MNISFETCVAVTEDHRTESDIRHKKSNWETVVEGPRIYPLETPIPFIIKGRGCYGYAIVTEYKVSSQITKVWFTVTYVADRNVTGALFNAYRNAISSGSRADYSDGDDTIIPGMGIRTSKRQGSNRPTPRSNGWNNDGDNRPLSSFCDD